MDQRFIEQFEDEDLYADPDPNKEYLVLLDYTTQNLSLLMKLIFFVQKYPTVISKIEELCDNIDNVRYQSSNGFTPLMIASTFSASFSTEDIVELLLRKRADPNVVTTTVEPQSAINLAIINSSNNYSTFNTVKLLVTYNADINIKVRDTTPLSSAASTANIECIQYLLANGAKITSENGKHIMYGSIKNDLNVVKLLFDICSKVMFNFMDIINDNEYNLLLYASSSSNLELCKLLLSYGASVHIKLPHNLSILHLACSHTSDIRIIDLLLDVGANINAIAARGMTPLMIAVKNKNISIESLLKWGADINAVTENGKSALVAAAMNGNVDATKLLLEAGSNLPTQSIIETLYLSNILSSDSDRVVVYQLLQLARKNQELKEITLESRCWRSCVSNNIDMSNVPRYIKERNICEEHFLNKVFDKVYHEQAFEQIFSDQDDPVPVEDDDDGAVECSIA
ncbi:MAG: ankyrin repeat domain-containing protein [Nitrososphaeraceae archaeon]|nr:ankyrin repeat domain-containing protein [Nitrososphaeraceae archaeon]